MKKTESLAIVNEAIELSMDEAPTYVEKNADAGFKLDVTFDNYTSFPSVRCTDKGHIYIKNGSAIDVVGSPATIKNAVHSIELIVFYIAKTQARAFYRAGYNPEKSTGPDCSSARGLAPSASVKQPVHGNCTDCPMAQWTTVEDGKNRPPACKPSRIIGIRPIIGGEVLEPHNFRVSQISENHMAIVKRYFEGADFKHVLKKYAEASKKGVPMHAMVLELSTIALPPGSPTIGQVWTMRLKRWATAEEMAAVSATMVSDVESMEDSVYSGDAEPVYAVQGTIETTNFDLLPEGNPSVAFFQEV